jgi:enterochelin esterase-like enzyme
MRMLFQVCLVISLICNLSGVAPVQAETLCNEDGVVEYSKVLQPIQEFEIVFKYYLPPCYAQQPENAWPVLYLMLMDSQLTLDTANRLMRDQQIPPAILILPRDEIVEGYEAALVKDLVSYVDTTFRTKADRRYRGVGGYSHGGANAARMALAFPEMFGSVWVFSGGIDVSEQPKFRAWLAATPREKLPRIFIGVGNQEETIFAYARHLTDILEAERVPYEFQFDEGNHGSYWAQQLDNFFIWFAKTW